MKLREPPESMTTFIKIRDHSKITFQASVGGGRWAVGGGRWAVGGGRWAVGGGRMRHFYEKLLQNA